VDYLVQQAMRGPSPACPYLAIGRETGVTPLGLLIYHLAVRGLAAVTRDMSADLKNLNRHADGSSRAGLFAAQSAAL
jgi:hypothetical protein